MADINVRSDAVDVEQIMRQVRNRIREKRGADYTEAELQQLANVKLEKFLDPRGIRSDLVKEFQRKETSSALPNFAFEDTTLFETHRGALRRIRGLLRPVLKLFFNPDKIASALHIQSKLNAEYQRRAALSFEVMHNLVLELTRLGIEVHNLKMRVESLSSRLDFDERRGRALESVVEYRGPARPAPAAALAAEADAAAPAGDAGPTGSPRPEGQRPEGQSGDKRRRRRRRRRRPGQTLAESPNAAAGGSVAAMAPGEPPDGAPAGADDGGDDTFDEGPDDSPDGGAADQ